MRVVLKWIGRLLSAGIVAIVVLAAIPARYPQTPRPEAEAGAYWDLPTGSRIGYWSYPAQGGSRRDAAVI